jgi:hypothetical protein
MLHTYWGHRLCAPFVFAISLPGFAIACAATEEGERGDIRDTSGDGDSDSDVDLDAGTIIDEDNPLVIDGLGEVLPDWPDDLEAPWKYDDKTDALSWKDPGFDEDIVTVFTGTVTTLGGPVLAYPLTNSLHPNNLMNITFQWDTGANTFVRIDVQAPDQLYHFYMACGAGGPCQNAMPESEWFYLGQKHAGQQVQITLNGVETPGGPVHASPAYPITFSPEPVNGALYYWSSAQGAVERATFGAAQAVPFILPHSGTNSYGCTACHSVSRDGNVIAFAVSKEGGENSAGIQVAPTIDPSSPIVEPTKGDDSNPTDNPGSNVALSPDGKLAAINGLAVPGSANTRDIFFEMRDATDGTQIQRYFMDDNGGIFGGGNLPLFPEFSPDGTKIAVQMSYHNDWDPPISCFWHNSSCASGISVLELDDDGTVASVRHLITQEWYGGKNVHYYPTWSPDGKYIAFVTGPQNGSLISAGSFQNTKGILRMVRADLEAPTTCPSADCWDLLQGTGYPMGDVNGFMSTWPKFTPFAQRESEDLFFISFTTRRAYGFQTTNQSQIWMFAVDAGLIGTAADPSYSPIWLPYQGTTEQNLAPYWTEKLPCQADPDGGCVGCADGESCITNADNTSCHCASTILK